MREIDAEAAAEVLLFDGFGCVYVVWKKKALLGRQAGHSCLTCLCMRAIAVIFEGCHILL
jgi:hypothetical protein